MDDGWIENVQGGKYMAASAADTDITLNIFWSKTARQRKENKRQGKKIRSA